MQIKTNAKIIIALGMLLPACILFFTYAAAFTNSIEIYPVGQSSPPSVIVSDAKINPEPPNISNGLEIITIPVASVIDISGVLSVVAFIKYIDPGAGTESEIEREGMAIISKGDNEPPEWYAAINTSDYTNGDYNVYLVATDTFGQSTDLIKIGYFKVEACWTCTAWSNCIDGHKTRTCAARDQECAAVVAKPEEDKTCQCTGDLTCPPTWTPAECPFEGQQTRICIDSAGCTQTQTQTCTCEPLWGQCSDWLPVKCKIGSQQTQTCKDSRCQNPDKTETRSCQCTPTWECTLSPSSCPASQKQTETCHDIACGNDDTVTEKACTCTPAWTDCDDWGSCVGGSHSRICRDSVCGRDPITQTEACALCTSVTKNGATLCVSITAGNTGTVNSFSVSPSSANVGTQITFTASLSSAISGQTIKFLDSTTGVQIGTATTNSSGTATLNAAPAFSGAHTIMAAFDGNRALNISPGFKTASLTLNGTCQTKNGATLCVSISTPLTR